MPPKAKFTREEIVNAGLSIVRKRGMGAVTARELGMELGSSARPVFTVFQSMEEVQEEIVRAAKDVYNRCVKQGLSQEMAFKSVGMEYIGFARREPQLFRLLFMRERAETPGVKDVLFAIDRVKLCKEHFVVDGHIGKCRRGIAKGICIHNQGIQKTVGWLFIIVLE